MYFVRFPFALLALILLFPAASMAQSLSDSQKAEIDGMIKEYIMNNGKEIMDSVNTYQTELEAEQLAESSKKAANFVKEIDKANKLPMAGNPKGDVTVVEFFDYNCGYCRKALEALEATIKADDNIKVIFVDMPILGPASYEAAKWSLAADKQGKYFEFHKALLNHNGNKGGAILEKIAQDLKLDIDKMKSDKDSTEISNILEENINTAQSIGVRGTPGFIIDGQLYPGYMPADQIKTIVKEARAK
jgi:protein-disulfide isomerase